MLKDPNLLETINCEYCLIFGKAWWLKYPHRWYHGQLSSAKTNRLLSAKTDGLFLVRHSVSAQDDLALMVCYNKEIYEYTIIMQNNCFTIDKRVLHDTLEDLINYHRYILEEENTLVTKLTSYVVKTREVDLVPWHKIKIEKYPRGTFGGIILGFCWGKRIMMNTLKCPDDAKIIVNRGLCHENLLNVLGLSYFNHIYYIITDYPRYGNLLDLLISSDPTKVTLENKIDIAYDISSGMEYLEKMLIPHKLLCAMNVLVTDCRPVKLTNFGLSEELPENFVNDFIRWQAPETISNNEYNNKSDMWSYGICLWEIFTHAKTPYKNIAKTTDIYSNIADGIRLDAPENCPQYFTDIMAMCWKWNPAHRLTFYELKKKLYGKKQEKYNEFVI